MSVDVQIRVAEDLHQILHQILIRRARDRDVTGRGYILQVLEQHCSLPTWDEWVTDLACLPSIESGTSGAEAVREARDEDEENLAAVLGRR